MTAADRTLVVLESPLKGDRAANKEYARRCMRDCISRGEAPFASHLLYDQPGLLDDDDPSERLAGIECGLAWGTAASLTVVYCDRGISDGMRLGIQNARAFGRPVVYRYLEGANAGLTLSTEPEAVA